MAKDPRSSHVIVGSMGDLPRFEGRDRQSGGASCQENGGRRIRFQAPSTSTTRGRRPAANMKLNKPKIAPDDVALPCNIPAATTGILPRGATLLHRNILANVVAETTPGCSRR